MSTLSENVDQVISDFDDCKGAIESRGVAVPDGTPTAEYGELIKSIQADAGGEESDPIYTADKPGIVFRSDLPDNTLNLLSHTKTSVSADDEIVIPKPYDPYYKSIVPNVYEFIDDDTTDIEDIARVYDNTAAASFESNQYIGFSDGLGLITSKTIEMEEVTALGDGIIYKTTLDLTEFENLGVI